MTTLVAVMLAAVGGAVGGALSRQPEINRLKKQVVSLQEQVETLSARLDAQDAQIRTLNVKYKAIKGFHFKEKSQQRSKIRGALIFQYAYKDYLELLMASAKNGTRSLAQEDTIFFNIFDKIIDGKSISQGEMKAVEEYEMGKHKHEIDNLENCDYTDTLNRLEGFSA